jgi:prepilin-type N-terminal cleavage/methylation domain-containing protein
MVAPVRRFLAGFSLAEMLVVVVVVAVLAVAALPSGAPNDLHQLDLVADDVTGLLRLAVSEARHRPQSYVLVDGKTQPGVLRLYISDSQAQLPPTALTSELVDPFTKRGALANPATRTLSQGVQITPQFVAAGQAWGQLLIGPTASTFTAFDGAGAGNSKGNLESGSAVVLTLGAHSTMISFNHLTGLVTRP